MILEQKTMESFLVHLIVFLLLYEWLYPLETFGIIYNLSIFILFLVLCFLLSFVQFRIGYNLLLVFLYIVVAQNLYFFKSPGIGLLWPNRIVGDLFRNLDLLWAGKWGLLTDSFRTFLMFLLLGLVVYLLRYWIVIRKLPFIFFILTIIYLSVLDTFTSYDAKFAIVRVFLFGLSGLGLVAYYRLAAREQLFSARIFQGKGMLYLIGVVMVTTSLGLAVPKMGPQWVNPFPFLDAYANHGLNGEGAGSGMKVIGYDEDDRFLGGPFFMNDTPVFTVNARHSQYWRVETKDVYTGKGWVTSEEERFLQVSSGRDRLPLDHVDEEYLEQETFLAFVETAGRINHFIYPYGTEYVLLQATPVVDLKDGGEQIEITGYAADTGSSFFYDPVREKLDLGNDMGSFAFTYRRPVYNINKLRSVNDATSIDEEFFQRYTQLPEQLPERVKNLAHELTAGVDNWFDKVRAIENYLRGHEFSYDTENVAIPGEEDDYVDQFLFETKRGYCDNFSTSMIVLLRSLGIPARWVKGYTGGTLLESSISEYQLYEIKNSHAHSWVEVYFPEVGWVPFEPTKGFTNFGRFHMEMEQTEELETPLVNVEGEFAVDEPQDPLNEIEIEETPDTDSRAEERSEEGSVWPFVLITGLLLAVVSILFFYRRRWIPLLLIAKYRNKTDGKSFEKAYLALVNRLEKIGLPMDAGVTLRDYAQRIDEYFRSKEMSQLTHLYEHHVYGNRHTDIGKLNWQEPWEQLMRKMGR